MQNKYTDMLCGAIIVMALVIFSGLCSFGAVVAVSQFLTWVF